MSTPTPVCRRQIHTVDARHPHIREHQIKAFPSQQSQGFLTRSGFLYLKTASLQIIA